MSIPRQTSVMRLWEKGDSAEAMGWLPSPIGWDPVEQTWYCHSFVERYHRFVRPLFAGGAVKNYAACDTVGVTGFF